MKCFLFDVDGTLTKPREAMEAKFADIFESWISEKHVYLVSGSDLSKIKEQIPNNILKKCKGIFSCMGNEFWVDGEKIYENKLDIPTEVENFLKSKVKQSNFEHRKPPHFEYRAGMLNFSVVGRGAAFALRQYYSEWDEMRQERSKISEEFNKLFNKKYNLEALTGGQISLDIQQIGKDKGQIIEYIDSGAWPSERFWETIFFGDKCEENGNDYSLAKKVDTVWHVKNHEETFNILSLKY